MAKVAVFEGLVFDEADQLVTVSKIGQESFYIVNDSGFLRHIPSEDIDRQVWEFFYQQIQGREDLLSEQTAKMLGQEDIFTVAMIEKELKDSEKQFSQMIESGIPEDSRNYLGMMGFKVVIDVHGEVKDINQPMATTDGEE